MCKQSKQTSDQQIFWDDLLPSLLTLQCNTCTLAKGMWMKLQSKEHTFKMNNHSVYINCRFGPIFHSLLAINCNDGLLQKKYIQWKIRLPFLFCFPHIDYSRFTEIYTWDSPQNMKRSVWFSGCFFSSDFSLFTFIILQIYSLFQVQTVKFIQQ